METKTKEVYISKDGREFLTEKECMEWEKMCNNIKSFTVRHNPDLNETGLMQRNTVVTVYSTHGCHKDIVENWCVREKKYPILQESVQGWGFQRGFEISDSQDYAKNMWEAYVKDERVNPSSSLLIPIFGEKVFLSPIRIEGFPEPFNYIKEWGFK